MSDALELFGEFVHSVFGLKATFHFSGRRLSKTSLPYKLFFGHYYTGNCLFGSTVAPPPAPRLNLELCLLSKAMILIPDDPKVIW